MLDYNAYIGEWPFYKLVRHTLDDLIEVHQANGIEGGYVSSLQSIFYNDFYESERDLAEILSGTVYHHVVTVNPNFPECPITLRRCIEEFNVKGVRIHPGYHGYDISSPVMNDLLEILREYKLPLFINAKMHDERLTHLFHPIPPDFSALKIFLRANSDIKTVLCHFNGGELSKLRDELFGLPNLYTDTSALRGNLLCDSVPEVYEYAVYGSDFPLYPVAASAILVKTELVDERIRKIFFERPDVLSV